MKLKYKIVTPEKLLLDGEADQITLPTQSGQITVLPHHIPLVSNLQPGEITIVTGNEELYVAVEGGFVEVQPASVVILADAADRAEELNEAEVEEAVKRAEHAFAEAAGKPDVDYAMLKSRLDKELSRLRVARRYKQRGIRTGN